MESIAATPPPAHHGSKPHVIELVDTPDCTSIDLTFREEDEDDSAAKAGNRANDYYADDTDQSVAQDEAVRVRYCM